MPMSKVPLRYFFHSRVRGILVLFFLLLLVSNSGKQSKQQSHSSQQHSNPSSPLPRHTVGSPGVSSMPVISIIFFGISLFIFTPYHHIKRCTPEGMHRKSVPSLLSHNLFPALVDMRKKGNTFCQDQFPHNAKKIFDCVTSIFYHIISILSIDCYDFP